jgi:aminotransferase
MGLIAKNVERIPPSGIRRFFDLVLGMPDVISLGVGEPDFVTPWRIREKAITALEEGMTTYTSNKGLMILRKAISGHFQKKHGINYDPETEILVTVGVSEAMDLALRAILDPGDKVIVVCPYFVAYPALVELAGGEVLYLPTQPQDGFKIDLKELKKLLNKKPKAIILNYPGNPSGVSYNREELKAVWRVLSKSGIIVLSDEVYEELSYENKHQCFAALDKEARKRTILLNGFSKAYAMTGFRSGYACAVPEIIDAMNKIHSYTMMCGPILSQVASVEALRCQKEVDEMVKEYRLRRNYMVRELNRIGMATHKPQGAFYFFSSVKKFGLPSLEFAKRLLFEEKVAVVPGEAFGKEYEGFIRMSYANSLDNLKEALIRMERFVDKL